MSLWKIAWRSIEQRALASGLTAFAMGLGVALVAAVLVIHAVIDQSFRRGAQGYDLIVGAKGESIQLVLNTVFHLGQPPETIPYKYFEELNEGRFSPAVAAAIPVAIGHDYKSFPVIATTPNMFDQLTYLDDRPYEFQEGGRNFDANSPFEAVVGDTVARRLKMKVGDTFRPTHPGAAIAGEAEDTDHEPVKIVGILKHTGTPNDGAIFMNLEGFYRFGCHQGGPSAVKKFLKAGKKPADDQKPAAKTSNHGAESEGVALPGMDIKQGGTRGAETEASPASDNHGDESTGKTDAHGDESGHKGHHHEATPLDQRQLSAVLVCTDPNRQALGMDLRRVINEESDAQAIAPAEVISQLFDGIIGNVQLVLVILAVLVVVVAGIGILVSIYNSMSDRRHEIAVMRALGASRLMVGTVILLESILLSLGGGVIGLVLGHGLIGILGPTIAEQTGVLVGAFQFQWNELVLIPGLIVLASLVGYLPAAIAYRTDVAKSLAANQ
jgi:putative ABC transport system permease protein